MTADINLLIIDDDEDDYFITSDYLKNIHSKNFNIAWCYNYNNAISEVKRNKHDLYLVDYRLGAKTGIDLIKEAISLGSSTPFILLTGKSDINIDEEAMKLGAFDYLIKSELSSEKLERSIRYSIDKAKTLNEIKAKEKKYRNIFNKSGDAFFVADEHLAFTEVNAAFGKLLVCGDNDLLGVELENLIVDKDASKALVKELIERSSIEDRQVEIYFNNSEPKQCVISATKEKTAEDKIYYQGILHDMSLIKKSERTALRAEKLAATGRLVRTLAHEVRNPINNINLAVEHLTSLEMPEDSLLYFDIISRNSGRINELIKELLNSSKPAEIIMQVINFNKVINEVVAVSKDRMRLKNIDFILNYPDEEILISCDCNKLVLALLNIITNAVEAIEHGIGKIIMNVINNTNIITIKIADNGNGISEERLPRLFEPYYTSKRNGIGLGLAFTLNIIQAHGGSIEIKSEISKGTVFTISLPVSQTDITENK